MNDLTIFVINQNALGAPKFFFFLMGIVVLTVWRECRRG